MAPIGDVEVAIKVHDGKAFATAFDSARPFATHVMRPRTEASSSCSGRQTRRSQLVIRPAEKIEHNFIFAFDGRQCR